jgi:hypothetical protein
VSYSESTGAGLWLATEARDRARPQQRGKVDR